MYLKKLIFLLFLFFSIASFATEGKLTLRGRIIDKSSKEPIPYASIVLEGAHNIGTVSNENGEFALKLNIVDKPVAVLKVSFMGYETEMVRLSPSQTYLEIKLSSKSYLLQELVVKPKRYRNKNNPAVELIDSVINHKKTNRTEALEFHQYEKYDKTSFYLNDITPEFKKMKVFNSFQFVFENTDTAKIEGKEMLPFYLREILSDVYYRRKPSETKEIVKANKMVNAEGYIDNEGIGEYVNKIYQDINIYDNNIVVLTQPFLSPIAATATTFYRYYIVDSTRVEQDSCVQLFFTPRSKNDMLFTGNMYITLDGTYAVKRIELTVDKRINLNWVNDLRIVQQFERTNEKGWVLSVDEIAIDFAITKKQIGMLSMGIFGERSLSYRKHSFDPPQDESIYKGVKYVVADSANFESDIYWAENRPAQLTKAEEATYGMIDSIQQVPVFKRTMNIAEIFLFGYKDCGYFEIGPLHTFYGYNPVEGHRLRLGGRTNNKLSKRVNFQTYLAYGFRDEKFKYFLKGSYSFTPRSIFEFPVKSLSASYQYETSVPGQDLGFIQENNVFLSIKRGANDKFFYNRILRVEHLNEFENHFSYAIGFQMKEQTTGGSLFFNNVDYNLLENTTARINTSEAFLRLRYAPNEQFYQGASHRRNITTTYPIFELEYGVGSKLWDADYNYHKLKLSIKKRTYLSVLGYTDLIVEGGMLLGKVSFPLLEIHRGNQSYFFQTTAYNLMNFLEFVSDKYVSINIDHCFNGFFFNKIPFLKQLKLREVVTCKLLWGGLSAGNKPEQNSDLFKFPVQQDGTPLCYVLDSTPYIEASVGIANIFKLFRVDLVKRFTYLDNPNVPEYGLRMRFQLEF